MKLKKSTVTLLAVSLALILLGSIFASLFNTGFGSVSVKRISFDTTNGSLSGLLYMPKGASESNPRPAVIVTHGYLNSAEMQDANAIELSRRGYVVLALDMYDHGHSKLNKDVYGGTEFFDLWSKFWIHSMNDAATYMYSQPYVLKDADGNGVMGVTGHSMGGFSSTLALAFDEQAAQATGIRKLSCGLTEGSDFMYTGFVGIDAATADSLGGGRVMGKVAARYDEFFFNKPEETGGTVREKDYVSTPDGQTFLQTENAAANTWYNTSDGGKRIIYEPAQTHPWNHFSKETTGYAIDFYKTAFAGYTDGIKDIASSNQIWQFKELFSFIALIGFVMFFIPFVEILLGLPFFNKAKTELPAPAVVSKLTGAKIGRFALMLSLVVVPAVFFIPLYDDSTAAPLMDLLFVAGIVFAVCGLVGICLGLRAEAGKGKYICGSVLTVLAGAALSFIAKKPLYQSLATWVAPSVNSIAVWTLGCAVISVLAMSLIFTVSKAKDGAGLRDYGISLNPLTIIASLLTACVALVVGYLILFAIDAVLHVDFRLWVFAYKTFDMNILPAVCKYLPTFFLFYFVSSASIFANTNTESMQGVKGYLAAIALNAGGSMLWLCRQYVTLFSTGVAAHPDAALSGIVLVAVCAVLVVAAIISRALYKKCGNIWVAAFLNAFLVTIMTIANTTVYMK